MKGLFLVSLASAIGFTAASAGAGPPAAEESDSRNRSSGFFAMDHEDHRDWTFDLGAGGMYLRPGGRVGFESDSGDVLFGVEALDLERDWSGWARAELKFAGKGFLASSLIASGPANIWADVLLTNEKNISRGIDRLATELTRIKKVIRSGNRRQIEKLLENARTKRSKLIEYKLSRKELI